MDSPGILDSPEFLDDCKPFDVLHHRGSKTFEVAPQFCEVASIFFYVGSTVF